VAVSFTNLPISVPPSPLALAPIEPKLISLVARPLRHVFARRRGTKPLHSQMCIPQKTNTQGKKVLKWPCVVRDV